MLDELTHVVQCQVNETLSQTGLGWHTIAAFNAEVIAEQYKRDCAAGNRYYKYRVRKIKGEDR